MPSPFPGMDPYLEARTIWPGVHTSMITYINGNYTGVKFGMRISSENTDPKADQTRTPCLRIVEI